MRSGVKNALVEIYRNAETSVDPAYNTPVIQSGLLHEVFASVTPRKGGERVVDGQNVVSTFMRFEFDFLDVEDVVETDWLSCEGQDYTIFAILRDLTMREYIQIDAIARLEGTGRA